MIRSELVAHIAAQNPHLYARDVEAVVATILDAMSDALFRDDRVEMRDFGTFSVRHHPARTGRNPRTGAVVEVTEKRSVHFKPGKAMRARLNAEAPNPDRRARFPLRAS